jgi:hypothetical protein
MTAVLAMFATLPSVLAAIYQPDFGLINVVAVAVITATAVACAISLKKKDDKPT